MEIFGVKFAPLRVPLERRLQTLSVALWFVMVAFGYFWGWLLAAYLIFCTETLRYFVLLYFLWIFYDRKSCERGGKGLKWATWLRNCAWMRHVCTYFPIRLVKTVDLDATQNYLFCCFPHGILSTGFYGAFGTDILGFKDLFPNLQPCPVTLKQHFNVPFFREYIHIMGSCCSSEKSLDYLTMTKPEDTYTGRAIILVIGGASESLECRPGKYRILLKRRKGFIKVALKNGCSLVPIFSFGETDIYDQVHAAEGSRLRKIQEYIRKMIGLAPVILRGRGFFQYSFGIIPHRKPITVVVGSPIKLPKISEPTTVQIEMYHKIFTDQLIKLFEEHKHKYIENASSTFLETNF